MQQWKKISCHSYQRSVKGSCVAHTHEPNPCLNHESKFEAFLYSKAKHLVLKFARNLNKVI